MMDIITLLVAFSGGVIAEMLVTFLKKRLKEEREDSILVKTQAGDEFEISSAEQERNETERAIRSLSRAVHLERTETPRTAVEIQGVLQKVLSNLQQAINRQGLEVRLQNIDSLPRVLVDQDALELTLSNIIHNAVKFAYSDSVIEIRGTAGEDVASLAVTNMGIAIGADEVNKIFEVGYRGREAVRRSVSGSGLGLYVARDLIAKQGGAVEATSVGEVTTISVSVPRENPSRHPTSAQPSLHPTC